MQLSTSSGATSDRFVTKDWFRSILSAFQVITPPSVQNSSVLDTESWYLNKVVSVTATIRPYKSGQIRFQGTWWRAACKINITLPEDTLVRITEKRGITFFVEPLSSCQS